MENHYDFKLIDGVFEPSDAEKVLISLINNKINYHHLEDFSNHIRFNDNLSHSKKRVQELHQTKEDLKKLIDQAKEKGYHLTVNSTIEITLSK